MVRSLGDARRWTLQGTRLFTTAIEGLTESSYDAPTLLPDWNRRQLVAHVAANAEALGNLVLWATTGVETPMYRSAKERAAGIARGLTMGGDDLESWLLPSAQQLELAMDALAEDRWTAVVVTAQGRSVPASETAWMRARVCVHAVDLDLGVALSSLDAGFLTALTDDVVAKRGAVPPVDGPLDQHVASLTGRPHALPDVTTLPAWL